MQRACAAGREGLIAKRDDAPYRGERGSSWLKLKCQRRQEFVVFGYTLRSDDAQAVGSLVLGVHDAAGKLQPAGSVGTGWDRAAAHELLQRLRKLDRATPPFDGGAPGPGCWPRGAKREHSVRPRLVVEVAFGDWTPAGLIRHASFVAVRGDKPARAIVREQALAPDEIATDSSAAERRRRPAADAATTGRTGVRLTHAERVIDAATGLTKRDLARYYDSMAEFLLPQLKGGRWRCCARRKGWTGRCSSRSTVVRASPASASSTPHFGPAMSRCWRWPRTRRCWGRRR